MSGPSYDENDPRHHASNLKKMLTDTSNHAREDVTKIDDPRAQALFETAAEVLDGLTKALTDFEARNESAWRPAAEHRHS